MTPSKLTIRARITGGSLLIAILISVVAGILIYNQVQRIVNDGQIALLENIEAPYLTALGEGDSEEVDQPGPSQLIAVIDATGLPQVDTLPASLSPVDLVETEGTSHVAVAGGSYLVRVTAVSTPSGEWHVISAVDDRAQASVLSQVAWLLIGSIAGINLAFAAASWLIGTAALRPVSRLRRSASELLTTGSGELLPVGAAHDEIAELASTLNALIVRLRESADRERQMVSDASHELRTPLAILTTQLELGLRESTSPEQLRSDVAAAQQTLTRLTALATSLLELSRLDAGANGGTATVGDLATELAECAERGRERVGTRRIRLDCSVATHGFDDLNVAVSAADFARACDNLVANSLRAIGDAQGTVALSLTASADELRIEVSDDAGGMDEEFVPHAFTRFSRSDYARTGDGAGLGLSIVRGIALSAGGSATLENRPGEGLTVRLVFPTT